jgi:eukaryotic-like serine/threonine-protein kinase
LLASRRQMTAVKTDRARPTATLPAAIGRYRVAGVLGQGGMGIVYRAQDPTSGAEVAVKTVRSSHETDLRGLQRESRALWRLRHPGVVRILEDGLEGGCPWFAMELLPATSLRSLTGQLWAREGIRGGDTASAAPARTRMDQSTIIDWEASGEGGRVRLSSQPPCRASRPPAAGGRLGEVLLLMRRLCGTLSYVHARGYVHRDLKPTNIFLRPDGSPVLVDFGLACRFPGLRAREALEPAGVRVGTIHYMAPEQLRAELVDARADIYSLGCLLYEAVTGRRPFEGSTPARVAENQLALEPTPPCHLVSDLPCALDDLILRLLVKDSRRRTAHAEEIAGELARMGRERGAGDRGAARRGRPGSARAAGWSMGGDRARAPRTEPGMFADRRRGT